MKIVKPIPTTSTTLTASDVPETDHSEWSSASTYASGDRVIVIAEHKIYESQISANNNKYPPNYLADGDPDTDPVVPNSWLEISATNKWKMFDGKSRAVTSQADSIEVEITPSELFNSLGILNIEADSVSVVVEDPTDGIVYSLDVDMIDLTEIVDFYEWFFLPLARLTDVVLTDLPAYLDATLTITLEDPGAIVEVGEVVPGTVKGIGILRYGTSLGISDFSRKEIDEYGNATIDERTYSKRVDYDVSVRTNRIYDIQRTLAQYRATPLLYIGVEEMSETVTYGFYKDFSIVLSGLNRSECSLQVEELS